MWLAKRESADARINVVGMRCQDTNGAAEIWNRTEDGKRLDGFDYVIMTVAEAEAREKAAFQSGWYAMTLKRNPDVAYAAYKAGRVT